MKTSPRRIGIAALAAFSLALGGAVAPVSPLGTAAESQAQSADQLTEKRSVSPKREPIKQTKWKYVKNGYTPPGGQHVTDLILVQLSSADLEKGSFTLEGAIEVGKGFGLGYTSVIPKRNEASRNASLDGIKAATVNDNGDLTFEIRNSGFPRGMIVPDNKIGAPGKSTGREVAIMVLAPIEATNQFAASKTLALLDDKIIDTNRGGGGRNLFFPAALKNFGFEVRKGGMKFPDNEQTRGGGMTAVKNGEGTWSLNPNNDRITFTPEPGFKGVPSVLPYAESFQEPFDYNGYRMNNREIYNVDPAFFDPEAQTWFVQNYNRYILPFHVGVDREVQVGTDVQPEDSIRATKLAPEATLSWKKKPDTSTPGMKDGIVEVAFDSRTLMGQPAGSREIPVKVTVVGAAPTTAKPSPTTTTPTTSPTSAAPTTTPSTSVAAPTTSAATPEIKPVFDGVTVKQGNEVSVDGPKNKGDFPAGTKFELDSSGIDWVAVDGNGKITVSPSTEVDPDTYTVTVVATTPDGVKTKGSIKVEVEQADAQPLAPGGSSVELGEKCVTALSVGIPLAVLLPLGLLAASQLPVISEQFNTQIQTANTEIQKQLGLFNPQLAAVIADADAQLRTIGADLGQVAGGIAVLVAAAGLIGGIASQCVPEIKQSSEGS